jgi:DNA-binding CsgD family transcriptional regulator
VPLEFQDRACELVSRHLPFDTGLWGMFALSERGPQPHAGHLYRMPWAMVTDYERVKQHDWVMQSCLANLGRTINANLTTSKSGIHANIAAHYERWGMLQILGTIQPVPELDLFTAISVYRRDGERYFSEDERALMQELMPHLVEALQINTVHYLDREPGSSGTTLRARARIDGHGVLHQAEPGLPDLIRREVEGWSGSLVPRPWLAVLAPGADPYRGKAVVVTVLRRLQDLTYLIGVRTLAPIDRLSPRQVEVVREFAKGKSHREIAEQLGTSPATVRTQIQAAYAKLGVSSKAELGTLLAELE